MRNIADGTRCSSVNALSMYYEIHGTGRPLALLHGALSTIETDFGKVLPIFARTRQVIAVEQQAHGHTADIDRPLSYEQMADDTAALLRQLKIEKAATENRRHAPHSGGSSRLLNRIATAFPPARRAFATKAASKTRSRFPVIEERTQSRLGIRPPHDIGIGLSVLERLAAAS